MEGKEKEKKKAKGTKKKEKGKEGIGRWREEKREERGGEEIIQAM